MGLYGTGYTTLKIDGVLTPAWQAVAKLARKSDCIFIPENVVYLVNLLFVLLLFTFMNFCALRFQVLYNSQLAT